MAYTTATLTGTYQTHDGNPATGVIEIIPNYPALIDAEGDVILTGRVKVTLDDQGSFSVVLPSTDDATVEPATGRQYTVSAKLRHQHLAAVTGIELAAGETVDMADVTSAAETNATASVWLTQEEYDATVARVAALEAAPGGVSSVNGEAGDVTLTAADVGADPAGSAAAVAASVPSEAELSATYAAAAAPSHAGARTKRYDPNANGYNWKASNTRRLRASLSKAQAGTALAHHAFIGDSETAYFVGTGADQLNMWPLVYRRALASRGVPVGGTGCVFVGDAGPGPLDPRWSYTGAWTNNNEYKSTSTSGATATFTADSAGTQVDVWYYGTSGGFTVSIDGATPVAVTPSGGLTVQRYTVTGLANTAHTVKVTTSSTSTVYLLAAAVTGASGLVVHNLARYGSTASGTSTGAWVATTDATYVYKARTDCLPATPDVVWIALGVNDINAVGATAATTKAAIQTIAGRFPNSDVILVAQAQPGSNGSWAGYVSALYDLADSLDVPLLDVYDRFGSTSTATTNGLMGDTVHPNSAAERDWGFAAANLAPASGLAQTFAGCKLTHPGPYTATNGAVTFLSMTQEEWDSHGFHEPLNNPSRITIPPGLGGRYDIRATVVFSSNATGRRNLRIQRNGGNPVARVDTQAVTTASAATSLSCSGEVQLAAGDYLECCVFQDSGANLALGATNALVDSAGSAVVVTFSARRIL